MDLSSITDTVLSIGTFIGGLAGGVAGGMRYSRRKGNEDPSPLDPWRTTVNDELRELRIELASLRLEASTNKTALAELHTVTKALAEQVTLLRIAIGELRVQLKLTEE